MHTMLLPQFLSQ